MSRKNILYIILPLLCAWRLQGGVKGVSCEGVGPSDAGAWKRLLDTMCAGKRGGQQLVKSIYNGDPCMTCFLPEWNMARHFTSS